MSLCPRCGYEIEPDEDYDDSLTCPCGGRVWRPVDDPWQGFGSDTEQYPMCSTCGRILKNGKWEQT